MRRQLIRRRRNALACCALLLAVCKMGPDYERPPVPTEDEFRGQSDSLEGQGQVPFGDREWFEVFGDVVLLELIETALEQNYDVRVAAERALQARSLVTITNADLYPEINAGAEFSRQRMTENAANFPSGQDPIQNLWAAFANLSWDIDLWGRYRRATEAARAELLQTEYLRRVVIQALVTDLALAYFDLLLLDEQLEITQHTYESRLKSLELVSFRLEEGVASMLEYRQAQGLVLESAGLIPEFEGLIQQQENLIRLLLGQGPSAIPRGKPLVEQVANFEVPLGLPSELLVRRPDVAAAEQALVAANARIGEAKALLYPSIGLTALGGYASEDLDDLLEGGSSIWDIRPSVSLPIFNAGRLRSNVEVTESQLSLATGIRNELFAYVLLYRSLGGGWQGAEHLAASGEQLVAGGPSEEGMDPAPADQAVEDEDILERSAKRRAAMYEEIADDPLGVGAAGDAAGEGGDR